MPNNTTTTYNRVYAPILIGISLLAITLVLYPLYTNYVDTSIAIHTLEQTQSDKKSKLAELQAMQAQFVGSGSSDLKTQVARYNHKFDTSLIIETIMLNKYTEVTSYSPAQVSIASISISPGRKLPSGLSLSTVSLSIKSDTYKQVVDYLTYLIDETPLTLTIDSISLPIDTGA
jgi:hypothetical protein